MYIFEGELFPTNTDSPSLPMPTVTNTPIPHLEASGELGDRTLWATFVIMLVSSLAAYGMAWRVPASKRVFHLLTALMTTASAITYYSNAVHSGIALNPAPHGNPHHRPLPDPLPLFREVYWARYANWAVTAPLVYANLGLLAGLNGADLLVTSSAGLASTLSWLFASMRTSHDAARWGFFAIGCVAHAGALWQLAVPGAKAVRGQDVRTKAVYGTVAGVAGLALTVYPIVWGVAEGAQKLGVDHEILAYAILDVVTRPGLGLWLLVANDALAESALNVEGFWAWGVSREGTIRIGDQQEGA